MNDWIKFSDRLPTEADSQAGHIVSRCRSIYGGQIVERVGLWNWIQPSHPQAKELWEANGFIEWRSLR